MKSQIALRKQAVQLHLQGATKTEIARRLKRSRPWVHRWVSRYDMRCPGESLQDHSWAPKSIKETYPKKIKEMVLQSRRARQEGKLPKYQYALIGAEAIYYELRELNVSHHPFLAEAG